MPSIAVAEIPEDQRFTWHVEPLAGRFLDARTVGKTLDQVCRIFTGDDKTGRKVFCALTGVRMTDSGGFEADIAVLPIGEKPRSSGQGKA